jgi:hypothetical protein
LKFDVFGRALVVERAGQNWVVYSSAEGRRSLEPEVVIPQAVSESELAQYLTDLFHVLATPDRPCVRRIG